MHILELQNISKTFSGSDHAAVKDFNLKISKGEIVALLGESGCGKTTILRMIAGFETPSSGTVILNGETVSDGKIFKAPQERQVGIVFQDYALFPHKTVMENVMFGLFRMTREKARGKAKQIIELSGLQGLEKRYPHQLSGGQKQRVALARALAPEPRIILFDEPFSNLDSMRKAHMRSEIEKIIRKTEATAVFVTHDTKDVFSVADKVAVIRHGMAVQTGSPEHLYNFPLNTYVADFFGKTNILEARVTQSGLETPLGNLQMHTGLPHHTRVQISIRPEQIQLVDDHHSAIKGRIINQRFLGEFTELTCEVAAPSGNPFEVIIYVHPQFKCAGNECCFIPLPGHVSIMNTPL
jgi:iron(III) transport system ATP-binding protein